MNKKELYESIMKNVAKQVKKALNESLNNDEKLYLDSIKDKVLGDSDWDAEDVLDELFNMFVPGSGKADTLAGELVRAINRIGYRYYNDGDVAGVGYGRETVNPAVRFLDAKVKRSDFRNIVDTFYAMVKYSNSVLDDEYEKLLKQLIEQGVIYIIQNELYNVPNNEDMWDYKESDDVDNGYDDEEYEDEGWDNYDDEENEEEDF